MTEERSEAKRGGKLRVPKGGQERIGKSDFRAYIHELCAYFPFVRFKSHENLR